MLFSSIPFLYYFLPVVAAIYFLTPKKQKNGVLLLSSLFFYGWGESRYVFWMLGVIVLGYCFGLLIEKYRETKIGKMVLLLSIGADVCVLGYFKYADFFVENWNRLTGEKLPLLQVALPIGISFYMFQIISYTIDVYRGQVKAQRNIITLAAYVSMFPQLIAGPIVRYADVEKQLEKRIHSREAVAEGIGRFTIGLSKKVLIANPLGECCEIFKTGTDTSVLFFWLYGVSFMLHIYFDFSGYSDMAIGLGKLFGFTFMENFQYPYISKSMTEFWRRWHISLGSWFRDYVYIPMGGNRVRKSRWMFNIAVVWFLTGFWHGASWNFIFWGLYFAVFLVVEKLWLLPYLKNAKVLNHIYVLFFVMVSFLIFDGNSLSVIVENIQGLVGIGAACLVSLESIYYFQNYGFLLLIGMVGATPLPSYFWKKIKEKEPGQVLAAFIEPVGIIGLWVVVTAYLVDGSFNPFLYFRF